MKTLLIALALICSHAHAATNAPDAKAVLDKVSKNVSSKDEIAALKMTIIEASGDKVEKKLEIRRKGAEKDQKILVKMVAPSDIKGIALLSKGSEQWLFTPSNKQVRRIQGSNKGNSFMGSELSNEDLSANSDASYTSKILETKDGITKIENTPKGESTYSKIVLWIDAKKFLVNKIEYFDKSGKLLKESVFSDYKEFAKSWRAQKIEVKNLQTKRGTRLDLSGMKMNTGLSDSEFSESALTEGD